MADGAYEALLKLTQKHGNMSCVGACAALSERQE